MKGGFRCYLSERQIVCARSSRRSVLAARRPPSPPRSESGAHFFPRQDITPEPSTTIYKRHESMHPSVLSSASECRRPVRVFFVKRRAHTHLQLFVYPDNWLQRRTAPLTAEKEDGVYIQR